MSPGESAGTADEETGLRQETGIQNDPLAGCPNISGCERLPDCRTLTSIAPLAMHPSSRFGSGEVEGDRKYVVGFGRFDVPTGDCFPSVFHLFSNVFLCFTQLYTFFYKVF